MTDELGGLPPSALETCFLDQRARLLSFLRHAGVGDQAEDLLQEAWFRVNRMSVAQPQIDEPVSYMFRLLHNLVLDWRRGAVRARRRNEAWAEANASGPSLASEEPDGERVLIARATLEAALLALDELGEPTAGIFRRHRLDGMPQRQIANELGMGLSTVEKHLRKAYRAMQDVAGASDD